MFFREQERNRHEWAVQYGTLIAQQLNTNNQGIDQPEGSRREKRRRAFMPLPVVFLDNSEWQKPGLTASIIRNLSRSLSLSPRAKKSSALLRRSKLVYVLTTSM